MSKRSADDEPTRKRSTKRTARRSTKRSGATSRPVKREPRPSKPAVKKRKVSKPVKPAVKKRKVAKPVKPAVKKRKVAKPVKPAVKKRKVAKPSKPAVKKRKVRVAPDQVQAIAIITDRLEMAQARLSELIASVKVYPLPSGPVDGELLVQSTDTDGTTTFRLMMEAFTELSVNGREWGLYWIALGLNYYLAPSETAYRRWRGLDQVQTNYQKANRANILEEILIVTHTIIPGMQQKRDLGVHSVFVRLHWNPDGEQPKR